LIAHFPFNTLRKILRLLYNLVKGPHREAQNPSKHQLSLSLSLSLSLLFIVYARRQVRDFSSRHTLHLLCAETQGGHLCFTVYGSQASFLGVLEKKVKKID